MESSPSIPYYNPCIVYGNPRSAAAKLREKLGGKAGAVTPKEEGSGDNVEPPPLKVPKVDRYSETLEEESEGAGDWSSTRKTGGSSDDNDGEGGGDVSEENKVMVSGRLLRRLCLI